MAFIPVPNVARLVMRFEEFGRTYTNTTYWQRSGAWTVPQLEDLVENAYLQWINWVLPEQSTAVTLLGPIAYSMQAADAPLAEYTPLSTANGELSSAAMPGNVTAAIKLTTAGRGKSARGRLYHIGLVESQVVDNELVAGVAANLQGRYINWWGDLETDTTADLGVVSFQLNGVERNPGVFQLVTGMTMDNGVDTQRRRVRPT